MIGRLTGKVVVEALDGHVVLDVGGVGYDVTTPVGTVVRAPAGDDGARTLHIHTHVREGALGLFGFATEVEKHVFRLLIGVPNVGPGIALRVLSTMAVAELAQAVASNDGGTLKRVKGIGKKTTDRLVLEIREKLPLIVAQVGAPTAADGGDRPRPLDNAQRLVGALTNMGYRAADAERAVKSLGERVRSEPVADLLKQALAALAQ